MPRRAFIAVLLVACVGAVLALASGCGKASPPPSNSAIPQSDSGKQQTFSAGQEIRIALTANPSTGYMWAIDGSLPSSLEQSGEASFDTTSGAIGAGGIETWTFTAKSAGQGTLKMKYWRSFEPTATPPATFEMPFTVQ